MKELSEQIATVIFDGFSDNCTRSIPSNDSGLAFYNQNGVYVCLELGAKLSSSICRYLPKRVDTPLCSLNKWVIPVFEFKGIVVVKPLEFDEHLHQRGVSW